MVKMLLSREICQPCDGLYDRHHMYGSKMIPHFSEAIDLPSVMRLDAADMVSW